jgi:hypothetical protein
MNHVVFIDILYLIDQVDQVGILNYSAILLTLFQILSLTIWLGENEQRLQVP